MMRILLFAVCHRDDGFNGVRQRRTHWNEKQISPLGYAPELLDGLSWRLDSVLLWFCVACVPVEESIGFVVACREFDFGGGGSGFEELLHRQ
jgi:hypothetical protein